MRCAHAGRLSIIFVAMVCFTIVFAGAVGGQTAKPPEAAPAGSPPASTKPAPPAQTTPPSVNLVTQAAVQAGVLRTASRINQVITFLVGKNKSSAYLFKPASQPDLSLFSVSLGIQEVTGQQRYASASFVPLANGVSAAVYDTVEYSDKSPAELEKSLFKNLKRNGTLGKDTIVLVAGPLTVFLMPAGSGSIVIKKEVVQ